MRSLTPRSFSRQSFVLVAIAAGLAAPARAQILTTNDASLITYKATTTTSVQAVKPLALQRGVNIDGTARGGGSLPWAFAGNPYEDAWVGREFMGSLRLDLGAWAAFDVDIALPSQGGAWRIGRTFNARQASDSNGPQGYNWFQTAQPEILFYDDAGGPENDLVYLVYGAERYLEFKRTGEATTVFLGTNGAAGVFEFKDGGGGPDLFEYTDQMGNLTVFFGFDGDAGVAAGQIWKWIPPFDPTNTFAYVGDKTTAATAISNGYDGGGRILNLYDVADRRYTFDYSDSTIGGAYRLEQVLVETKSGGTWASPSGLATVAQVDYSYYGDESYGDPGDLKLVTISNILSDGSTTQTKKKYYRYWEGAFDSGSNPGHAHAIKYIYDFEGVRNFDWTGDSDLDGDFLTASNDALKPYAAAYFEYDSSHRVNKAWFNGQCGCSGAGTGTYELGYASTSFSGAGGYDEEPLYRTVIERPDGSFLTQYFDETGQALSRLVTDTDPSASPTATWWTGIERDSTAQVTDVYMPDAVTAYDFAEGTGTYSSSVGLVKTVARISSGDAKGFLSEGKAKKAGTGATAVYDKKVTWTSFTKSVGSTSVVRPLMATVKEYPDGPTSDTGGNQTAYTWTAWSGLLVPEGLTITHPTVTTANNGSNSATYTYRHFQKDGTVDWEKSPDGSVTYREYSNGQVTKVIEDADTGLSSSGQDFYGITVATTPVSFSTSGGDAELHRKSVTTYDAQGRVLTTSTSFRTNDPYSIRPTYHTRLGDDREVVLSYADYDSGSPTWYGPVSYTVLNQAGKTEVSGSIALAGNDSTAAQSTHIDEAGTDPITAVDTGSSFGDVVRLHTFIYDEAGTRLEEERSYFAIPGSSPGTDGTHYDATVYGYDDMGHRWRVKQPHGTIERTAHDLHGRVTERWIGTNDNSFDGGEASGPDDMFKTEALEYDGGADGGLGLLTKRTLRVNSTSGDDRVTDYVYDARGRLIVEKPSVAPYTVHKVDNLGRRVATGLYSSASGLDEESDPTETTSTNRMALSETYYDERGQVWKSVRWKIDDADGSKDDSLPALTWYDADGRVVKVDGVGERLEKTAYDGLGRVTDVYTLAKDDDSAYADVLDVGGDIVLLQRETAYDPESGEVVLEATVERHFDDIDTGETEGALDTNADGDELLITAGNVAGRIQISASWYDDVGRVVDRVEYGRYSGSSFDRDGLSVPARSDTALRTSWVYNDDGTVKSIEDPKALKTYFEYDALGRRTKEVKNWDGSGSPSPSGTDDNVTVRYEYTDGLRTKLIADMPSGTDDQETVYSYGTVKGTSAGESNIATGYLLQEVAYPDTSGSDDVVRYAYNAQSQEIWKQDQKTGANTANVFQTDYDKAGRVTHKRVSTLGTNFDGAVRRISTTYDSLGRRSLVTQYDNATVGSGSVTDEVKYTYDDWGNIERFEQDKDSAVAPSSGNEYDVAYTFEKKETPGRNNLRKTTMVLPSGTTVTYTFLNRNGGHDNNASRVTTVAISGTTLALYDYNGVGSIVGTDLAEADVIWKLHSGSSASFPDLDDFNRVVVSKWTKDLGSPVDFYNVALTYDRNSNITSADDSVHAGFDIKYTMDDTNRLIRAEEGTLSAGSITSRTRDQQWTLSHTGNWDRDKVDLNGDLAYGGTDEVDDTRTHNDVNELTGRNTDSAGGDEFSLVYDDAGNLTDDGDDYEYVWDAFYRLRKVLRTDNQALVAEYRYNGLGYKIAIHEDTDTDGDVDSNDKWYYDAFDERWRQVARFRESDTSPKEEFVHHQAGNSGHGSASYIDLLICRNKDANTAWTDASDGTLEESIYYCQNQHADVVALVDSAGQYWEGDRYSAYGVPFGLPGGDTDSDGDCDATDVTQVQTWIDAPAYDVRGDIDLDGDVDTADKTTIVGVHNGTTVGRMGLTSTLMANRRGTAAGSLERTSALLVSYRNRLACSMLGRWSRRDPAEYVDGASLYVFNKSSPVRYVDPSGKYVEGSTICYAAQPRVRNSGGSPNLPTQSNPGGEPWTLGPPKNDWAIAANSGDLASIQRGFGDCVIPLNCVWSGNVRIRLVKKDDQGNWVTVTSDSDDYADWHCPDCLGRIPATDQYPDWESEPGGSGGGGTRSTPPRDGNSAGNATIDENASCGSMATLTFTASPARPGSAPSLNITFEFLCEPCSRFGWRRSQPHFADLFGQGISISAD